MSHELDYSIVLPCYLEEENLRVLLPRLANVAASLRGNAEIIVVGTTRPLDDTAAMCERLGAVYVNREPSDSFGDAVRTGIAHARGRWTIFMDADGSHPPEFIPRLIAETPQHDVVIASRYVPGGATDNSRTLIWMSRILNWTYAAVLRLPCADVSNSFKLYRSELLQNLNLRCSNFDVVEEILFKIVHRNRGVRIKEVPFTFRQRMFGRTKRNLMLFMLTYLFTILRLRFYLSREGKRGGR